MDQEVDIRKSILKIYNKQERDFSTLREYNNYLEEIEDIIWSLQTGRKEKETKEKVALYKYDTRNIRGVARNLQWAAISEV